MGGWRGEMGGGSRGAQCDAHTGKHTSKPACPLSQFPSAPPLAVTLLRVCLHAGDLATPPSPPSLPPSLLPSLDTCHLCLCVPP